MRPAPVTDGDWITINRLTRHALFILLAAMLTTASACAWLEISTASGSVLFQDDFSLDSSGWDRYQDSTYQADYAGGAYRISVNTPNTWAWTTPRVSLGDVRIEVDATTTAGPDNNVFGIVCRYQDWRNFLFFLVSSDGFVGIGIRRDGANVLLSGESLQLRDAVLQGAAANHLRADCLGEELQLFVNGFPVAQARSSDWSQGDVGLVTGTYAESGVVLEFDNFSVLQP
jgi:hypothetical protein